MNYAEYLQKLQELADLINSYVAFGMPIANRVVSLSMSGTELWLGLSRNLLQWNIAGLNIIRGNPY